MRTFCQCYTRTAFKLLHAGFFQTATRGLPSNCYSRASFKLLSAGFLQTATCGLPSCVRIIFCKWRPILLYQTDYQNDSKLLLAHTEITHIQDRKKSSLRSVKRDTGCKRNPWDTGRKRNPLGTAAADISTLFRDFCDNSRSAGGTLKSISVSVCFRGISRLPPAFVFLRWFRYVYLHPQGIVCKKGIFAAQAFDNQYVRSFEYVTSHEYVTSKYTDTLEKIIIHEKRRPKYKYCKKRIFLIAQNFWGYTRLPTQNYLKFAERVHIYILQHPTKFQAETLIRRNVHGNLKRDETLTKRRQKVN